VYPEIGNVDWLTLGILLVGAVPAIAVLAWRMSRPVSRQFLHVAHAARQVARGDFSARAPLLPHVPQEFTELAFDFNEMTARLQSYEREVRDSSTILAHELRTPLNAAMGRLQVMIDGVFPADQEQLQTVMRRLGLLDRLVDDLHLLSLARAGQLVVERSRFNLADLIEERLSWIAAHIESGTIRVTRDLDPALTVEADRECPGQVFSILMDNALRYAADGGESLSASPGTASSGYSSSLRTAGPASPRKRCRVRWIVSGVPRARVRNTRPGAASACRSPPRSLPPTEACLQS